MNDEACEEREDSSHPSCSSSALGPAFSRCKGQRRSSFDNCKIGKMCDRGERVAVVSRCDKMIIERVVYNSNDDSVRRSPHHFRRPHDVILVRASACVRRHVPEMVKKKGTKHL